MGKEVTREEVKRHLAKYFGKVENNVSRYHMLVKFVEIDANALELLIAYSGIMDEEAGDQKKETE